MVVYGGEWGHMFQVHLSDLKLTKESFIQVDTRFYHLIAHQWLKNSKRQVTIILYILLQNFKALKQNVSEKSKKTSEAVILLWI